MFVKLWLISYNYLLMALKLNIGSDVCRINGFVNIDIRSTVGPDVVMDIRRLGFSDECVDEINLGNILEHLTLRDAREGLEECFRVLDKFGSMYVTVPLVDIAENLRAEGQIDDEQMRRIIHGEGNGPNSHKVSFRSGDVERLLLDCGFKIDPLDKSWLPYVVVSNINEPKIDPWQHGIVAKKA